MVNAEAVGTRVDLRRGEVGALRPWDPVKGDR
jgi:hypothetical protein